MTELPEATAPQTVMDVFALIYKALHAAGKLCGEHPEVASELAAALDSVPQSVVDGLVRHLRVCFEGFENQRLIGITFAPSEDGKFYIATAHINFAGRQIPYMAPYSAEGVKELREQVDAVMNKLSGPSLILPNHPLVTAG